MSRFYFIYFNAVLVRKILNFKQLLKISVFYIVIINILWYHTIIRAMLQFGI